MADEKKDKILSELTSSYWMEMETVMNYVCNSVNLDGVRAEEVKKALAADVQEELGHAPWPDTSVDPDAPETLGS